MDKLIFELPQERIPLKRTHLTFRTDTIHMDMINKMMKDTGYSASAIIVKCIEHGYENYEVRLKKEV